MPNLVFKNFTKITTAEKEQVLNWRNSDRIRLKMLSQNIISPAEHAQWIDSLSQKTDKLYFLACIDTFPIGVVDFTDLNFSEKSGSFGYYTDQQYTMYAPLIETELLKYFFDDLNFEVMKVSVLENNQKVYSNHKKYFHFKDAGMSRHAETQQKIFNLLLQKSDWKTRKIFFETQLRKTLRIQQVMWE